MTHKKHESKKILLSLFLAFAGIGALAAGALIIWVSTIQIPDFNSFEQRKVSNSTKIYDNTGQVVLYDVHQDEKRTEVPIDQISNNIKNASVAIEDSNFYNHSGIALKSFFRAAFVNVLSGNFSQGGSTITQQIMKNTLLTKDKTIVRKLKEWILALKVEQKLTKDEILSVYLNGNPYGGSIYGVEEASVSFFGVHAKDIDLAQAAYIAAIPKAPSFYSPYGKNKEKLDERKNLVLSKMKELEMITQDQFDQAKNEVVVFKPQEKTGMKAPHFVFYIRDYLEQKYGTDMVESGGLKVTTTLDWNIQQKAEEAALSSALKNQKEYNASNQAVIALDPHTGQILAMVGSRNYFDKEIDGNFNAALGHRQPGSSFKPFVYATAFEKGYTPDSILFDVPTEFNPSCPPDGSGSKTNPKCYSPDDFDNKFEGPISLRYALGESRNIPAVGLLYLTTIKDSLKTAKDMGINSLTTPDQYGLTLVLGGGEVSLLDMTSAYGVFANEGVRVQPTGILQVEDNEGTILESYSQQEQQVLPKNVTLMISDVLSDNNARAKTFGLNSPLVIPGRDIAVKTGTTNNNKDAWMIGYSPSMVVGVWSGNNDNTSMKKGSIISGSTFNAVMSYALKNKPSETFEEYQNPDNYESYPLALRGYWQGGKSYVFDKFSGLLATNNTPPEARDEKIVPEVHSILYWIDRDNPTVTKLIPGPSNDGQYKNWEYAVQKWWSNNPGYQGANILYGGIPNGYDSTHTDSNKPVVTAELLNGSLPYHSSDTLHLKINLSLRYSLKKIDILINGSLITTSTNNLTDIPIKLADIDNLNQDNEIQIIATDSVYNKGNTTLHFLTESDQTTQ